MKARLAIAALLLGALGACTPAPPWHGDEGGPDFGPDPGTDEGQNYPCVANGGVWRYMTVKGVTGWFCLNMASG